MKRIEEPVLLVVFGASGDLAHRKLIPALYHLAYQNLLPPNFTLLGFARTKYSDEEFRELARDGVKKYGQNGVDEHIWRWFERGLFYQQAVAARQVHAGKAGQQARGEGAVQHRHLVGSRGRMRRVGVERIPVTAQAGEGDGIGRRDLDLKRRAGMHGRQSPFSSSRSSIAL